MNEDAINSIIRGDAIDKSFDSRIGGNSVAINILANIMDMQEAKINRLEKRVGHLSKVHNRAVILMLLSMGLGGLVTYSADKLFSSFDKRMAALEKDVHKLEEDSMRDF